MTKMTKMEGWTTKKKKLMVKECLAGTREEYSVWRKKMKMKMKRGRGWMKSQAGPVVRG
jgi:hypothetical protein